MDNRDLILEKEQKIKTKLEELRQKLNAQRMVYNQNPNYWAYLPSLVHTEKALGELLASLD